MKIKNKSQRLVILNFKSDKAWISVPVEAGETIENDGLSQSDVAHFVKEGSLEVVKVTKAEAEAKAKAEAEAQAEADAIAQAEADAIAQAEADAKANDPIVLVLPVTNESLKALKVAELKQYCKENEIKGYSSKKEDELIAMILTHLEPQE